jgi:enoyl-CoA hydratase/carnithine racemase
VFPFPLKPQCSVFGGNRLVVRNQQDLGRSDWRFRGQAIWYEHAAINAPLIVEVEAMAVLGGARLAMERDYASVDRGERF